MTYKEPWLLDILELVRRLKQAEQQPKGCICPPTSEQTCQNGLCPRKGISAAGGIK